MAFVYCLMRLKQVAVRACSHQCQNKLFFIYLIDQKPVRLDVTFTESFVVASEGMVFVFGGKRLFVSEQRDDLGQQFSLATTFRASL